MMTTRVILLVASVCFTAGCANPPPPKKDSPKTVIKTKKTKPAKGKKSAKVSRTQLRLQNEQLKRQIAERQYKNVLKLCDRLLKRLKSLEEKVNKVTSLKKAVPLVRAKRPRKSVSRLASSKKKPKPKISYKIVSCSLSGKKSSQQVDIEIKVSSSRGRWKLKAWWREYSKGKYTKNKGQLKIRPTRRNHYVVSVPRKRLPRQAVIKFEFSSESEKKTARFNLQGSSLKIIR
jgi:hypothetical protein